MKCFMRVCATIAMLGLSACATPIAPSTSVITASGIMTSDAPLSVFLVRHAEKLTGDDPGLTMDGQARADALADLLIDANIEYIHSSDYQRTRQTATPLADRLGLTVELYDPRDLPGLAAQLKADGGRHLIVGHSNTTGELTDLLGGDSGTPIIEATEYDRLYVVTRGADGDATSTLLRFGATSPR